MQVVFGAAPSLADLISVDEVHHLALLKLRNLPAGIVPVTLDSAFELKPGEWVVRQSRAPSGEDARSLHLVESIHATKEGVAVGILSDQGSSEMDGAPLVNAMGQIVGLYVHPPTSGGFIVPTRLVIDILAKLKASPKAKPLSWAGLELQGLSGDLKQYFAVSSGVLISSVEKEGPAAKAGLRPADVIESINDKSLSTPANAIDLIEQTAPGTRLMLGIKRNAREQNVEMTVAELPGKDLSPQSADGSLLLRLNDAGIGGQGVEIVSIQPPSVANEIGLKNGDVILAIDGKTLRGAGHFWSLQRGDPDIKRQLWAVQREGRQFFIAIKERVIQP